MKALLRLRLEGMCVLEMDPDSLKTLRISETETMGEYMLTAANDSQEYILLVGSVDQCHTMLNKIHNLLDVHCTDIL